MANQSRRNDTKGGGLGLTLMVELLDVAGGREVYSCSDLNQEPMEGNDVDN